MAILKIKISIFWKNKIHIRVVEKSILHLFLFYGNEQLK
ncbi:hypothetical protein LEP1GSC132_1813 [Leptospira kirschneri str. 200803703]|nr:hypothetical protein LEP1GSC132_1813 [Leptospira kirschneri str. 200803703]